MRHTRHRRDANHVEIERALRKVTVVLDIHNFGGGMGDLLARHVTSKEALFLEIKSRDKDSLTPAESVFASVFHRNWRRVHSVDEALAAIGIVH